MMIKTVFNTICDYVQEFQSCKREIEEQIARVDPHKMVLTAEFDDCTIFHQDNKLVKAFKEFSAHHKFIYSSNKQDSCFDPFVVDKDVVKGKTRGDMILMYHTNNQAHHLNYDSRKDLTEPDQYGGNTLAYSLNCWEEVAGNRRFLTNLKWKLLLTGQGQDMVDFFKAVNDLKDYSDDIKRPPSSGKKIKVQNIERQPAQGFSLFPDMIPNPI